MVDMIVRIIWAQFEGIPKKKTMSSLQAEESKSHGEERKARATGRVPN